MGGVVVEILPVGTEVDPLGKLIMGSFTEERELDEDDSRGNPNHDKAGKFASGPGGGAAWSVTAPAGTDKALTANVNGALSELASRYSVEPIVTIGKDGPIGQPILPSEMAVTVGRHIVLNSAYFGQGNNKKMKDSIKEVKRKSSAEVGDDKDGKPVFLNSTTLSAQNVGDLVKHEYGHVLHGELLNTRSGHTARTKAEAEVKEMAGLDKRDNIVDTAKLKSFGSENGFYAVVGGSQEAIAEGFVKHERGDTGGLADLSGDLYSRFRVEGG